MLNTFHGVVSFYLIKWLWSHWVSDFSLYFILLLGTGLKVPLRFGTKKTWRFWPWRRCSMIRMRFNLLCFPLTPNSILLPLPPWGDMSHPTTLVSQLPAFNPQILTTTRKPDTTVPGHSMFIPNRGVDHILGGRADGPRIRGPGPNRPALKTHFSTNSLPCPSDKMKDCCVSDSLLVSSLRGPEPFFVLVNPTDPDY